MAADKFEEEEDIGSTSSDSFINDSDNDEPSTSGQDDQTHQEVRRCYVCIYSHKRIQIPYLKIYSYFDKY